jgi:hypothetical protein
LGWNFVLHGKAGWGLVVIRFGLGYSILNGKVDIIIKKRIIKVVVKLKHLQPKIFMLCFQLPKRS